MGRAGKGVLTRVICIGNYNQLLVQPLNLLRRDPFPMLFGRRHLVVLMEIDARRSHGKTDGKKVGKLVLGQPAAPLPIDQPNDQWLDDRRQGLVVAAATLRQMKMDNYRSTSFYKR